MISSSRSGFRPVFPLVAMLLVLFSSGLINAAAPASVTAQVGLKNTYKIGCWTEVQIDAPLTAGLSYQAEVSVLDADGNHARFVDQPVTADEAGRFQTVIPVLVSRLGSDFAIQVYELDGDQKRGALAGRLRLSTADLTALTQSEPWLVAVGRVDNIEITSEFVSQLQVTTVDGIDDLPENSLSLSGVNVIAYGVTGHDLAALRRLKDWVNAGGHLVAFPDVPAEEFLATPFAELIPATFEQTAQIRDLSRLESFVGEASRLRVNKTLNIPRLIDFPGETLVGGLTGALAARMPWGLGRLTFCTLNLNDDVLQDWEALPQLFRVLADFPAYNERNSSNSTNLLTQAGLSDFKTQWDAGLSDFGLMTPSVWIPLSLLLVAALLVGPVDYFLVRHVLKKPGLTWITLPLLVILTVGWGIYSAAQQKVPLSGKAAAEGRVALVNQALVADYAGDTRTERYRRFVKVLVPETGRFDVSTSLKLPYATGTPEQQTAPSSVPEATFRGYYRASGTHLDQTSYEVHPLEGNVTGVPIHERSTLLLETSGISTPENVARDAPFAVSSNFSGTISSQLKGSLSHSLDGEITNWLLAYDKLVFFVSDDHPLATLSPGEVLEFPGSAILQRELTAFLTGTTKSMVKRKSGVGEDLIIRRRDYDPFSRDLEYIISLMTFYEIVGGEEYTKLSNIELTNWDLSESIALKRAVLVGKVTNKLPRPDVEGETVITNSDVSFVRFVLPVEQSAQALDRLPEYDKNGN
ncbi:hypothetical protein [Rubinisphaera margarita]|uniref:hypothetical protein n=1 Tax=Rubinisphaera margarita TaxID=2909586 RepID=UPI001EE8B408|nr:hypothetical protein [Rubinisphaera margarita]MCG6157000.1 hypothetical protein [Rubinisphaera margarita]